MARPKKGRKGGRVTAKGESGVGAGRTHTGPSDGDWTPGGSRAESRGLSSEGLFARDLESRYVDGSVSELEDLLSGLAAMAEDRFGGVPVLDAERLLSWAGRHPYPPALVLARGLALLGPARLQRRAAKVADGLMRTLSGEAAPADLERIEAFGSAVPQRAVLVVDRLETALRLFLECRRPADGPEEGRVIGMYLEAEFTLGLMATGCSFDVDVERAVEEFSGDERFVVTELSLGEAGAIAARSRSAFDVSALDPDDERDLMALESKAIVDHYFQRCPEGALPVLARSATEAEINAAIDDFMSSPRAAATGVTRSDVDLFLSTIADLAGHPLRFNPTTIEVVAQMLIQFGNLAGAANGRETTAELASMVTALVEYAGEYRALPRPARNANRSAVERFIAPLRGPASSLVLPRTEDEQPAADMTSSADWADAWIDVGPGGPVDLDEAFARHTAALVDFLRDVCASEVGREAPSTLSPGARDQILVDVAWPFDAEPDLDAIADDLGFDDWDARTLEDIGGTEALAGRLSDALFDDPVARMSAVDPVDWMRLVWRVLSTEEGYVFDVDALARLLADADPDGFVDPEEFEHWSETLSPAFHRWRGVGVFDADGRLTEVGRWSLPRAFGRSVGHDFDR